MFTEPSSWCSNTSVVGETTWIPFLIVRMAPPADTWLEIAVELWNWREEVLLATKVGDFLLSRKYLTTPFFVPGVLHSCSKKRIELQFQREKRMIRSAMVCGHGQRQSVSRSSTEDASSIIVRVLQLSKKTRYRPDCGKDSPRADHDAQGSCVGP